MNKGKSQPEQILQLHQNLGMNGKAVKAELKGIKMLF